MTAERDTKPLWTSGPTLEKIRPSANINDSVPPQCIMDTEPKAWEPSYDHTLFNRARAKLSRPSLLSADSRTNVSFHNIRHSNRNSQLDALRRRNMPSAHLSYAGDLESHELSDNFEVDCTKGVVFLDRENIVSGHCHLSIPCRLTWTGWKFLSGCDAVDCVCGKFHSGSYGWFFSTHTAVGNLPQ